MICEHKRESRSAAPQLRLRLQLQLQPRPRCRCPESSWPAWLPPAPSLLLHDAPLRRLYLPRRALSALRQSVEPLLTSVECLPPHSFTHDSLQTALQPGV